jgi:dGTPase
MDLIEQSQANIQEAGVKTVMDVRNAPPLIAFSRTMRNEAVQLKRFLHVNLYQHYQVNRMTSKARRIVQELFHAFLNEPRLLPPDYQFEDVDGVSDGVIRQARLVADYIAGMTDRYAMREHRRLFMIEET